jgi:hypothetical protein
MLRHFIEHFVSEMDLNTLMIESHKVGIMKSRMNARTL